MTNLISLKLIHIVLVVEILAVLKSGFRGFVTAKGTKMLKGSCAMCRNNKSITVSDSTIEPEGLKDFSKSVGKATVNFGKKLANNPVTELGISSKKGTCSCK